MQWIGAIIVAACAVLGVVAIVATQWKRTAGERWPVVMYLLLFGFVTLMAYVGVGLGRQLSGAVYDLPQWRAAIYMMAALLVTVYLCAESRLRSAFEAEHPGRTWVPSPGVRAARWVAGGVAVAGVGLSILA